MVKTIDMQDMRHLNLFEKITKIRTRFCFKYNETIIFCVPKSLVFRAVGEGGENVRKISSIIGKRIKIIPKPRGLQDTREFISAIISPIRFKNLEITDNEIILLAGGTQNKAALFGRNKQRFLDMQKIIQGFFSKDFRIA